MFIFFFLFQILDHNEETFDDGVPVIDLSVLAQAVAPYPQLKAALFRSEKDGRSPADLQDVTLYQLLQVRAFVCELGMLSLAQRVNIELTRIKVGKQIQTCFLWMLSVSIFWVDK